MCVAAAIGVGVAGAGLAGSAMQAGAASDAADAQSQSAAAGIAEQRRQFDTVRQLLDPYVQAGNAGLSAQKDLLGLNGAAAQQAAIDALKGSPQFTSALRAGNDAILANASATGGLRGGNTQNALSRYSGDLLSSLIQKQYSNLGGLTSIGQNAAAGVGNAGLSTGNNVSTLLGQQGAAQAGGILAGGNAAAGGLNSIANGLGTAAGLGAFGGGSGYGYTGAGSLFGGSAGGVTIPQTGMAGATGSYPLSYGF